MSHALHWQKSTFSDGGEGNTCVELAATPTTTLHLRESEVPDAQLTISAAPLTHLIRGVKSGQFLSEG